MKKSLMILSSVLLLTACNKENPQLQEKETLQKEIKDIKSKISDEKIKHKAINNSLEKINKELELIKGSSSHMSNTNYTDLFNTYAKNMGDNFKRYADIEEDVKALKKDPNIQTELDDISKAVQSTSKTFDKSFSSNNVPESFNNIHDQIMKADKNLVEGIDLINQSYKKSDQAQLTKAQEQLKKGIDQFDQIQFN